MRVEEDVDKTLLRVTTVLVLDPINLLSDLIAFETSY